MAFTQAFTINVALPAPTGASATVSITGAASYTFTASSGSELDPYVDPEGQFTQRNILCTNPGLPHFRAYYRPDVSGGREEWVFELGTIDIVPVPVSSITQSSAAGAPTTITTATPHGLFNGCVVSTSGLNYTKRNTDGTLSTVVIPHWQPITVVSPTVITIPFDTSLGASKSATVTATLLTDTSVGYPNTVSVGYDLSAYTVSITRANGTVVPVSAATSPGAHYWHGRWRWQSAVRPVRKTAAQLVAAKTFPRMDPTGWLLHTPPAISYPNPMTYASITVDQGAGGDYFGLGFLISHMATWLMTPTTALETQWRAAAEASGTFQVHHREATAPYNIYDLLAHPTATMFYAGGAAPTFGFTKRNNPDGGHFGSLTYVPYLLTGDPYYLEEHQFWMTHIPLRQLGSARWGSGGAGGRYYAWPLRTVAQAVIGTPTTTLPSWIKTRAYCITLLDQNRDYAENYKMTDPDPWSTVFRGIYRSANDGVGEAFWSTNFISLVASFLTWAGRTEWRPFAVWTVYNLIQRCNGTSGWNRQSPDPYFIPMRRQGRINVAMTTTQTTMTLRYPANFSPGEVLTIDGTETITLVSTTDHLTWNITRAASPKTHPVNTGSGGGLVYPLSTNNFGGHFTAWNQPGDWDQAETNRFVDQPGDILFQPADDLAYHSYHIAGLAMALQAGLTGSDITDLGAAHTWLHDQIQTWQGTGSKAPTVWAQFVGFSPVP